MNKMGNFDCTIWYTLWLITRVNLTPIAGANFIIKGIDSYNNGSYPVVELSRAPLIYDREKDKMKERERSPGCWVWKGEGEENRDKERWDVGWGGDDIVRGQIIT